MLRDDNRKKDELRPVRFLPGFQRHPLGSVLACCGDTRVLCAVSAEEGVPGWLKERRDAGGWITAQYQMLPGATRERTEREVVKGKVSGRSAEIQRLIGRSLRAMVDLERLPGLTLHVDCDVVDADGGTRCAAISGASLALELAARRLVASGRLAESPVRNRVAAVSVGVVSGEVLLDLCYEEDSAAEVDMNVVMTDQGRFVELQGTGEKTAFSDEQLQRLLEYARNGLRRIFARQAAALAQAEEGRCI